MPPQCWNVNSLNFSLFLSVRMTIFSRSKKGSFALESLEQNGPKYVTTEFGTKVIEEREENKVGYAKEEDDEKKDKFGNDVMVATFLLQLFKKTWPFNKYHTLFSNRTMACPKISFMQ